MIAAPAGAQNPAYKSTVKRMTMTNEKGRTKTTPKKPTQATSAATSTETFCLPAPTTSVQPRREDTPLCLTDDSDTLPPLRPTAQINIQPCAICGAFRYYCNNFRRRTQPPKRADIGTLLCPTDTPRTFPTLAATSTKTFYLPTPQAATKNLTRTSLFPRPDNLGTTPPRRSRHTPPIEPTQAPHAEQTHHSA